MIGKPLGNHQLFTSLENLVLYQQKKSHGMSHVTGKKTCDPGGGGGVAQELICNLPPTIRKCFLAPIVLVEVEAMLSHVHLAHLRMIDHRDMLCSS